MGLKWHRTLRTQNANFCRSCDRDFAKSNIGHFRPVTDDRVYEGVDDEPVDIQGHPKTNAYFHRFSGVSEEVHFPLYSRIYW